MLIGSEKDQASYLPKHGTFGLTVDIAFYHLHLISWYPTYGLTFLNENFTCSRRPILTLIRDIYKVYEQLMQIAQAAKVLLNIHTHERYPL